MLFALIPDPFEMVGVFFAVGVTLLMLYAGYVAVRSLHQKVDQRPKRDFDSGQHDALQERAARLEEVEARLAELEERVDFTERMLARPEVKSLLSGEER